MENINSVSQGSTNKIVQAYSKNFDAKVLILLEHEGQVKDCAKWLKEIKGQKQVIALSPFAIYEMDKQNIPYRIPEDYYDPSELYQLGMNNYQTVENICAIIDKSIHKAHPTIAKLDISPAFFSFYHLTMLYDAATIRLFQLFKVVDAENPDVILIYGNKSYPFGISDRAPFLLFDNRESIYAHLLALAGWKVSVVVLPPVQQPEDTYVQKRDYKDISNTFTRKAVGWLQLHPRLYALAVVIRNRKWRGLFGRLKDYLTANKKVPVLLLGGGYNWYDSREALQSVGIGPFLIMTDNPKHWLNGPVSDKIISENLSGAWQELQVDSDFHKFFKWNNIDFLPILEERLRFLVEQLTPVCLKAYEEASEVMKSNKIRAILGWSFATCTSRSAAQAARNAGIPVVIWQHGNYGDTDQPMIAYTDLVSPDVHFAFGEGVVEKYGAMAEKLGTQLIPIGSSSLDRLHEKIATKDGRFLELDSNKKTVLYISTNFYQNDLYISFPPPFSDNLLWQTQRTIADVLRRHNEYNVIIKTHPNLSYRETPLRSYAKESGFQNCQCIRNEYPFTDLLPIADIIVIDCPSTTLLQSLVTEKPVFAYFGHLRIDSNAKKLLQRRAYCFDELSDFVTNLEAFLSDGVINIKVNLSDKAFLEKYGIYKSDGKSAERAAEAVKRILDGDRG